MMDGTDEGVFELMWQGCGGTSHKKCWEETLLQGTLDNCVQQMFKSFFEMCAWKLKNVQR